MLRRSEEPVDPCSADTSDTEFYQNRKPYSVPSAQERAAERQDRREKSEQPSKKDNEK